MRRALKLFLLELGTTVLGWGGHRSSCGFVGLQQNSECAGFFSGHLVEILSFYNNAVCQVTGLVQMFWQAAIIWYNFANRNNCAIKLFLNHMAFPSTASWNWEFKLKLGSHYRTVYDFQDW